jgi:UDP-N-acetyl-D-mannosaminuronic acid transferase (WecB/TagA/CpsF family)
MALDMCAAGYRDHEFVLGLRLDGRPTTALSERALAWARLRQSRYVCWAGVAAVLRAREDVHFRWVVNSADMVHRAPDLPTWLLSAAMREKHGSPAQFYDALLRGAERDKIAVGLLGWDRCGLNAVIEALRGRYKALRLAFCAPSPDRDAAGDRADQVIRNINSADVGLLLVGPVMSGSEQWMLRHKGRIRAVMVCGQHLDRCATAASAEGKQDTGKGSLSPYCATPRPCRCARDGLTWVDWCQLAVALARNAVKVRRRVSLLR